MFGRSVVVAIAVAVAVGGCGAKGFKREVVVHFDPRATDLDRATVRTVCSQLPGVKLSPDPAQGSASAREGSIRFDVTGSSEREVSKLYACLNGKPGVVGAQGSENNM